MHRGTGGGAGDHRDIHPGLTGADGTRFVARFAGEVVAVFALGRPQPLLVLRDRPALQPHIYFTHDLALTADGREVGCAQPDGGISFHDVATGQETTRLVPPGMERKPATVAALSASSAAPRTTSSSALLRVATAYAYNQSSAAATPPP